MNEYDDNDMFTLTPYGCLYAVLDDYGITFNREISGKIGEHIVDDFMELMVKCGHVGKVSEE